MKALLYFTVGEISALRLTISKRHRSDIAYQVQNRIGKARRFKNVIRMLNEMLNIVNYFLTYM